MINFIKYVIRYWTHYEVLSIPKNSKLIKPKQYHRVVANYLHNGKTFILEGITLYNNEFKLDDGVWHYHVSNYDKEFCDLWERHK